MKRLSNADVLKKFLTHQRLYSKFCCNMIRLNDKIVVKDTAITDAFCWAETPQGDDFWYGIHIAFQKMWNDLGMEEDGEATLEDVLKMWWR